MIVNPLWVTRLVFAGAIAAALATAWAWRYQAGLKAGRLEGDLRVSEVTQRFTGQLAELNAAATKRISELLAERDQQQRRADEAEARYAKAQQEHARTVADLGRTLDRMRGDIAAFAAGGGGSGSAETDLAACRDRAGALGNLLGQALQASAACAADGESDRAAARSLWDAWPVIAP